MELFNLVNCKYMDMLIDHQKEKDWLPTEGDKPDGQRQSNIP
jgi:hypothetical protein